MIYTKYLSKDPVKRLNWQYALHKAHEMEREGDEFGYNLDPVVTLYGADNPSYSRRSAGNKNSFVIKLSHNTHFSHSQLNAKSFFVFLQ